MSSPLVGGLKFTRFFKGCDENVIEFSCFRVECVGCHVDVSMFESIEPTQQVDEFFPASFALASGHESGWPIYRNSEFDAFVVRVKVDSTDPP